MEWKSKRTSTFTCRCSGILWWQIFPIACNLHVELVAGSWRERRHSMWSTSGRDRVPAVSMCGSVIYVCSIDSVRVSNWPWHCHISPANGRDSYWWGHVRLYRNHISQSCFCLFLQHASIACYAEWCISYDSFCLTVWPSDRLSDRLSHAAIMPKRLQLRHAVFTGG